MTTPVEAPGGSAPQDTRIATLRALLEQKEDEIDLARAKVLIDQMVDPSVDAERTLWLLEQWANKVKARIPPNASNNEKLQILLSTLYEPGPWNDHRPFEYDYSDPFASKELAATMLSTYFDRRQGQCVIMPVAFVLLGQKLGLPVTLATAPNHILAKFGDEELGFWSNVEATSGRVYPDNAIVDAMRISQVAMESGIYLRPLSRREAVALMALATLVPYYHRMRQAEQLLEVADLLLEVNPRDVIAMTDKANSYYLMVEQRLLSKYPVVADMPPLYMAELNRLIRLNETWFGKAESLGWRQPTREDRARYLELFERKKAEHQGGL